jgi:DNA repair protein RadC
METRFSTRTFRVLHTPTIDFGRVEGPADVVPFLRAIYRDACDADREHFVVVPLDARGRILGYKIIGSGILTGILVHPREVFSAAIAFRASSIVVSHSHPSGSADPSDEDLSVTSRLIDAGKLLGIPLIDHIIVASSGAPDSAWRSVMPRSARTVSSTFCR